MAAAVIVVPVIIVRRHALSCLAMAVLGLPSLMAVHYALLCLPNPLRSRVLNNITDDMTVTNISGSHYPS